MSKIESIKPNYQPKANVKNEKTNFSAAQSFGAEVKLEGESKKLYEACKKGLKTPMMTVEDFLAKNDGELQTQIITAIFTTTLAPIMIAFNPFSKKDKKDKEYLSLRQPVSALIALGCVMPATNIVNKVLGKMGSTGAFRGLDIRIAPDKFYLKPEFDKKWKAIKNNEAEKIKFENELGLDEDIKELRNSSSPIKKLLYKANLKTAYTEKIQKDTREFFAKLINASDDHIEFSDGKVIVTTPEGVKLPPREIPRIKTRADLDEYLNNRSLSKRKFGDFMKDNFGFEFYKDGSIKPDSTLDKLKNVNAKEFLETLGIVDNADGEALKRLLSTARQGKTVEEIRESVPTKTEDFVVSMTKQNIRDIHAQVGEKGINDANMSLNQLIDRLNLLNVSDAAKNERAEKLDKLDMLMKQSMSSVMESIKKELVKNDFNKLLKDEKGIQQIAMRYMKKMASKASSNFTNFGKYFAMGSNLFITAISCTILNWAYPRFVEKFFPSLVKSDKPSDAKKGGN